MLAQRPMVMGGVPGTQPSRGYISRVYPKNLGQAAAPRQALQSGKSGQRSLSMQNLMASKMLAPRIAQNLGCTHSVDG